MNLQCLTIIFYSVCYNGCLPTAVCFLDNPDWFKKSCLQGYLASETSINAAIQQERAANIVDTSNVDELDFGSFNTRDINKILGSPNTVNQSAIDAFTGR